MATTEDMLEVLLAVIPICWPADWVSGNRIPYKICSS